MQHRPGVPVCALVLLAFLVALTPSVAAAVQYPVYAVEAETFSLSKASLELNRVGKPISVSVKRGGAAWRWVQIPGASRFVVRVRATTCGTPPRMLVKLGNASVYSSAVSTGIYADFSFDRQQAAGAYVLSVWFKDDKVAPSGCTRALRVDKVSLWSEVPVNQGIPGSVCQPTDGGIKYTAPPSDYSTTSLGAAPGYYELAPARGVTGDPAGYMVLVHGGGWYLSGHGAAASMRGSAELWRDQGWSVLSISSSGSCGHWVDDALWFYDRLQAVAGDVPICVTGHSAGGHVALMVAAHRPDVHCAISAGGPTDLVGIRDQLAYSSGGGQNTYPTWIQELAIAAFGSESLGANSPLQLADQIRSRTLLSVAERDQAIPAQQVTDMNAALEIAHPDVRHDAMVLEAGPVRWVHASVSQVAFDLFSATGIALAGVL